MHIPDGFLDAKTAIACAGLSVAAVSTAAVRLRKYMPPERLPLLGLCAAFLFAAQMVNFPIAGGTSGHLVGSVLAAALLGLSGSMIVMTAVLVVQSLLFADGGLLALGANVLNMAVAAPAIGSATAWLAARMFRGKRGYLASMGFGAWISVVAASVLCAGELAWSGVLPWSIGVTAMMGIHALIGAGEAAITMLVIAVLLRSRPDLLGTRETKGVQMAGVLSYGLVVSLAVALFVSPFASQWPDGLERVASTFGFSSRAVAEPSHHVWLMDYRIPGIESAAVSTALAGAVGTLVALGASLGFAALLLRPERKRSRQSVSSDAPPHT